MQGQKDLEFKVSKALEGRYWLNAKCGKDERGYPPLDGFGLIRLINEIIGDWKLKKNKEN